MKNNELTSYLNKNKFGLKINLLPIYELAYMVNQKAACSTINLWLSRVFLKNPFYENKNIHKNNVLPTMENFGINETIELMTSDGIAFSFVRHPVSRIISCYHDKIYRAKDNYFKQLILKKLPSTRKSEIISFEEFFSIVSTQSLDEHDPHWRPQYINTMSDKIKLDYIGKIESFSEDLRKLQNIVGLPSMPWQHLNKAHEFRDKKDVENEVFPNRQLLSKVVKYYSKDFELFGYDEDSKSSISS